MSWYIGTVQIRGNAVLAPMTKITDLPFRLLCRDLGAHLAFTEMVNCNAVSRGNLAAKKNYLTVSDDLPLGIQLLGSQPEKFVKTALIIGHLHDEIFFDVNFCCPDSKVVGQGAGTALLRRPKRMREIVSSLIENQPYPVTAKILLQSPIQQTINTVVLLEEAGLSAITIQMRNIFQKDNGRKNWKIIKKIKKIVNIPIIGNGGISQNADSFHNLLDTGCDAVMIGQAAIHKPGLFNRLARGQKWSDFSAREHLGWLRKYYNYAEEFKVFNLKRFNNRISDFFSEIIPPTDVKKLISAKKSPEMIIEALEEIICSLE